MPAVVVSAVVGVTIVGATVVGATGVGATEFSLIQSTYVFTLAYTPGKPCLAQLEPHDTTPVSFPLQTNGPPLSPPQKPLN